MSLYAVAADRRDDAALPKVRLLALPAFYSLQLGAELGRYRERQLRLVHVQRRRPLAALAGLYL